MSKLDWFTILVIAVCVLAIGALIWNAKNLYQDTNKQAANTDISEDYVDSDADNDVEETYDLNIDGDGDGDNGISTEGTAGGSSAIQYDSDVAREAAEADAEEARMAEREAAEEAAEMARNSSSGAESGRINTNTSPSSGDSNDNGISSKSSSATTGSSTAARSRAASASEGKYMVLIGSYTQMISAERMLRSVRSKGYRSARIEKFNNGKYARVLVDRRKTLNSARDLQAELVSDGFRDIQIKEK
jgi:cell division septation protein DedD